MQFCRRNSQQERATVFRSAGNGWFKHPSLFKNLSRGGQLLLMLGVACGLPAPVAVGESYPQQEGDAPQRVRAALEAEIRGEPVRRAALLEEARTLSPDYAPARWQSGQVLFDGSWVGVDDVQRRLSDDATWQQYQQLRSELGGSVLHQIQLAEWCKSNGLAGEERIHWRNVLEAAPNHRRARGRLGLRPYQGGLYTEDEIRELENREEATKRAFSRHEPVLLELRQQAKSEDAYVRDMALTTIAEIDDPTAIEAMCSLLPIDDADRRQLMRKLGAEGAEALAEKMELAIVSALGRMPQHQATLTLLDVAVFSSRAAVRQQAAEQLKVRAKTDYVPLLMSRLAAPIEADIRVVATPDGVVKVRKELFQAGAEANTKLTESNMFRTVVDSEASNALARHRRGIASNVSRATSIASAARAQVAQANALNAQRNDRIRDVLETTTGMSYGADVQAWWDAWQEYNDMYAEETPTYDESYSYSQVNYITAPPTPPPGRCECFVAGTPVWTKAGLKPIQHIAVGDQVLAQDPVSGELAYRTVRQTTIRPPTPVFRILIDDEEILTTRGHRFWVNGAGWRMVGSLEPDMALHAVEGARAIDAIEDVGEFDVFNLVVDDFHTYFVGKHKLLVHDSHCPNPTTGPIPGMARLSSSAVTKVSAP